MPWVMLMLHGLTAGTNMIKSMTFGKRLAVGFGLAGLVLLIIATVSYRSVFRLIQNDVQLIQTYDVLAIFADLLSQLKDIESGARGYALTGNDAFLAPHEEALAEVKDTFTRLQNSASVSANHGARVTALSPLIDARIGFSRRIIDTRRSEGLEAAAKLVAGGDGRNTMTQIRSLVSQATQEETDILARRTQESQSSAQTAMTVSLWGSILGAVAVALIGFLITRSLGNLIGGAVGQVRSSSAELQAAASQQANSSKEQTTATTEINTTIAELLATSRQIAESAQRVSQIADHTAEAARSGNQTVDTTHDSIAGIRRQVDQVVAHMLELGKKSQEIGAVVDIVSELAEQTNILAINATIEAAGAGDAGKRFTIVADEIRKLADRVAGSAKEIRSLIEDVRGAVNTTVMSTETGSKAVDAGSKHFQDVTVAFQKIVELVATTTESAREIVLSTKQQTSAVEQVNLAINSVAQASRESEVSAGQTLQTASQLATLSVDLLRIVRPQAA